jgi:hypothetical protein
MGVLSQFALWCFFWATYTTLSTTCAVYGVLRAFSTEKEQAAKTVDNPVDKRRACRVCGAHEWIPVIPPKEA